MRATTATVSRRRTMTMTTPTQKRESTLQFLGGQAIRPLRGAFQEDDTDDDDDGDK